MERTLASILRCSLFLLLLGTAVTAQEIGKTPVVPLQLTSDETAPAGGPVVLPSQVEGAEGIVYPHSALEEHVEGTVRLKVLFNDKGEVVQTETLDNGGDARLLHATVSGLNRSRFTPGTMGGEEREMRVVVTADFRIEKGMGAPADMDWGESIGIIEEARESAVVPLEDFESITEDEEQDITAAYPEFFPDAVPPQYDTEELLSHLVYPKKAQENGLEGTVYVKAAIDKTGKVVKVSIVYRSGIDSDVFDKAAVEAVRKTRFTPAIQAGYPVAMLPIRFVLAE